jgi:hypothetical protein
MLGYEAFPKGFMSKGFFKSTLSEGSALNQQKTYNQPEELHR